MKNICANPFQTVDRIFNLPQRSPIQVFPSYFVPLFFSSFFSCCSIFGPAIREFAKRQKIRHKNTLIISIKAYFVCRTNLSDLCAFTRLRSIIVGRFPPLHPFFILLCLSLLPPLLRLSSPPEEEEDFHPFRKAGKGGGGGGNT